MSATGSLISLATVIGLFALLALGLNIKFGTTGILDFGHVAYYLVGAYVATLLVLPPPAEQPTQEYILGLDLPDLIIESVHAVTGVELTLLGGLGWLVAVLVAIIAAGFLGLVVALPAIRLRDDYLAIALLGVSVILLRVVQSPPRDITLVNGPDSIRGYSRPFNDLIPLPGSDLSAAILLGLAVFTVWVILLWLLVREESSVPGDGFGDRATRWLLVLTTLGAGYWAVERSRDRRFEAVETTVGPQLYLSSYAPIAAVATGFGAVAIVASMIGLGTLAFLLLLGAGSAASWLVAWVKIRHHYADYDRRSALAGLAITIGLFVALAPAYALASQGTIGYVASFVTFGLLVALGWVLYDIKGHLDRFSVPGDPLGIVGIATVWLLTVRYFILSLRGSRSVGEVVGSTIQNVFWLVEFGGAIGPSLNYRRFFLIMLLATVAISYVLMELVLQSPHGRVLKAVRADENVAMALGKNTFMFKVQAMVLGSALGGLAGAMGAIYYRAISYNLFRPDITFFVFLAVILGGKGNNKGVILGAGMYWLFVRGTVELAGIFPGEIGSRVTVMRNAIIGLLLIGLLYYRASGIWEEEPPVIEVGDG